MAPTLKLIYWDAKARAESTRLALHIAGIPFEDFRLKREEWATLKQEMPFGQVPVLDVDGFRLAQSMAILRYAGNLTGLYPKDALEAAKVDMWLAQLEDYMQELLPSFRMPDGEAKLALRKKYAEETLPALLTKMEALAAKTGSAGHLVGDSLTIADLQLYASFGWFKSGILDGIPKDVTEKFVALEKVYQAVAENEKVKEWNAAHSQ